LCKLELKESVKDITFNNSIKETSVSITVNSIWDNIGVFQTPNSLAQSFVEFILKISRFENKSEIQILDLFAGDGRLGFLFSKKLEALNLNYKISYLEIRKNTIPAKQLNGKHVLINQNVFHFKQTEDFDYVISNPPYLILNANKAQQLGFTWEEAKCNSRNLYGLGIRKGLELCKPGGYLAVIAPFGYLRGINGAELRQIIDKQCDKIWIRANTERNLFKGVNQDIAFQLLRKRIVNNNRKAKWEFAYNGEDYKIINITLPLTHSNACRFVRVGPIVWNRKKELLSEQTEGNISLIYGGNITHQGTLNLSVRKYQNKQNIKPKGTVPTDLLTSPFIAIRRTVRGKPGSWKIDSVLVNDKTINYTAENHVITVELPKLPLDQLKHIQHKLVNKVLDHHFYSGSPNISTKTVSKLFSEIIIEYL